MDYKQVINIGLTIILAFIPLYFPNMPKYITMTTIIVFIIIMTSTILLFRQYILTRLKKRHPQLNSGNTIPLEPISASLRVDEDDEHLKTLKQLTPLYILKHDGITPEMMAGCELPPAEFLNAELSRQGALWRVRSVEGGRAETYDLA